MSRLFLALLSVVLLNSCLSTTTLRSSDPDARVHVEDQVSEKNVLEWTDRQTVFGHLRARVEKPGCAPQSYVISRSDEFFPEGFLSGFLSYGVGFLWSTKYQPEYVLRYECVASGKAP